jgi:hypothetical protein
MATVYLAEPLRHKVTTSLVCIANPAAPWLKHGGAEETAFHPANKDCATAWASPHGAGAGRALTLPG